MKNLISIKNTIIVILCITIIFLGIGFSYLAMQLKSSKQNEANFNVDFYKALELTPVQGGSKMPTVNSSITNSNKTITMQFNLFYPRDEINYKIIIKNTGNIPAQIINFVEVPDYLNNEKSAKQIYPVKITHNDIVGKKLDPDEEVELTITAYFNYKETAKKISVPYQINIIASSVK